MKLEAITSQSKEIFLEGLGVSVTVNTWSNLEEVNVMVHDVTGCALRMAGAFRWEELDILYAALAIARSA